MDRSSTYTTTSEPQQPTSRGRVVAFYRPAQQAKDDVTRSDGAEVMFLAADLALGEDEVLQPDLFVYPKAASRPKSWLDISELLLVVEIVSPSTARYDRGRKRRRYQRARVPEYWLVDPDARVVERPDDEPRSTRRDAGVESGRQRAATGHRSPGTVGRIVRRRLSKK